MKLCAVSITNPIGKGKDFWFVRIVTPRIYMHTLLEVLGFFSRVVRLRSSGPGSGPVDDAHPSAAISVLVAWHEYNYRWCWGFPSFKWTVFAFFTLFKGMIIRHEKRLLL